jgi:hypothetical protein
VLFRFLLIDVEDARNGQSDFAQIFTDQHPQEELTGVARFNNLKYVNWNHTCKQGASYIRPSLAGPVQYKHVVRDDLTAAEDRKKF